MNECPRFPTCDAPICPLDPSWRQSAHLPGEPVCYYLRATGKPDAAALLAGDRVFPVALQLVGAIGERFPAIGRAVELAARTGFRGAHLRKRTGVGGPEAALEPPEGSTHTTAHR